MRRLLALIACLVPSLAASQAPERFLAPARDRALIDAAIAAEAGAAPSIEGVTGITVPHHLLAPDLIARGFWAAAGGAYDRIILIGPDHFEAVAGRFATSPEDVATIYGPLTTDADAVAALLDQSDLFEPGSVWGDHALYALSPFVEHFFPGAEVVPILAAIDTTPEDWIAVAEALAPLVDARTLVVQSTDFSHYLPVSLAALRDGETLATITAGDVGGLVGLRQPDHLDSRTAMAVQMLLQDRIGAHPVILANRNSAEYGVGEETTSYMVAAWHRDPAVLSALRYPDQEVIYFGGDILLGRYFEAHIARDTARDAVIDAILAITGGAPLVANLEGVMFDLPVANAPDQSHVMERALAGPVLTSLGLAGVGLANNHSYDFGEDGYAATLTALAGLGLTPLEHGIPVDLGPVRVVALNLMPGGREGPTIDEGFDPTEICGLDADAPLVAFVHWGREYVTDASDAERGIARGLATCGVSLVVGGHSHRASPEMTLASPGVPMVYSVGNLLFDQIGPDVSSALLEVRVFRQGTLTARLIPLENLFALAQRVP